MRTRISATPRSDASGNRLGPFTVGQVVKVRTKVANSTGSRTSAVRTITLAVPIVQARGRERIGPIIATAIK